TIQYLDNGTVFVVQWDKVYLQGKEDMGSFTFQAALHSSGRIVFGYKEIPVPVLQISASQHPVKAGLSDAFTVLNPAPDVPGQGWLHTCPRAYYMCAVSSPKSLSHPLLSWGAQPRFCLPVLLPARLLFLVIYGAVIWPSFIAHLQENAVQDACLPVAPLQRDKNKWDTCRIAQKAPNFTSFACFPLLDDTKLNQYAGSEGAGSSLPSTQAGAPIHTGAIVGIVLAVVVVAAVILAGIYINSHPTSTAALFFIERRPHHWPTMKFRNHTNHATYAEVEAASQEKEGFVEAEQC
ncbi:Plexin domain-containing protein 1, partial [Mesitornis unicolor]